MGTDAVEKPLIIGAGSCIIEAILWQMGEVAALTDKADLHLSQILPGGRPLIEPEVAARCAILIEEAAPWQGSGTLTEEERKHLPENCVRIAVPTLHFSVLWPLMTEDPRNVPEPGAPYGRIPYVCGDRLGLKVVQTEPDPAKRRAVYDATDLSTIVNLSRALELETRSCFAREQGCEVRVAAYVMSHFRQKRLYFTQNHPTPDLIYFVLAQIYAQPVFRDLLKRPYDELIVAAQSWARSTGVFQGEEVPVHPYVAARFGLEWWKHDHRYPFQGIARTFDEWMDWYLTYTPAVAPVD